MVKKCPKCKADNPDIKSYCGECGTQLEPVEDTQASFTKTLETPKEELNTGSIFAGRYQIIEELGKGGMGKVYKVLDKEISSKIALKLIKPEVAGDKKNIERFRSELKLARDISHKHVCRMYDLNKEKGNYYITMEYVSGEDLKSFIRRAAPISTGRAILIAKQVCEGLTEAHRLGIVHRDLKPSNIMIDNEGNARIMDFGIARTVKGKGITGAGVMIGTPEYMSPEQVEAKDTDQRSDIYSLGIILYEMTTGRLPFEADTPFAVGVKHKSEIPKSPRELNVQILEDLSRVILKCLEKDIKKRYQSPAEFLKELKKIESPTPETPVDTKWKDSIAVFPFTNMSADPENEYFSDGLSEELINALTKIKGLRVVARTSSFAFKGEKTDLREVGQKLNVETLLEGSVRKAGNKLRITAQLIKVKDGYHLWSERYDRNIEDIFDIQDEITAKIVEKFKATLDMSYKLPEERRPDNLKAYDLYLKGRYLWNKFSPELIYKSITCFEESIKEDPDYALPYTALAEAYSLLSTGFDILPSKDTMPKAREAALKALELDPTLAEAYVSLGLVSTFYDWDRKAAERNFRKALELNPNSAAAHQWIEFYLTFMEGKFDEGIKELKKAQELDPLNFLIKVRLGYMYIYKRDFDSALDYFKILADSELNLPILHLCLMEAYAQKKMYAEAIAEGEKMMELGAPAVASIGVMGFYYALTGKKNKAHSILAELRERSDKGYVSSMWVGTVYHGLGETDKAFEWFEKAYDERDGNLIYITIAPPFDSIRPHPRFKQLMKKMGLENLLET